MVRFSAACSSPFRQSFLQAQRSLQKHETEKKRKAGIIDNARGRKAAALDARGAALGCVALACFAAALWRCLPDWNAAVSLGAALAYGSSLALLAWRLRRFRLRKLKRWSARIDTDLGKMVEQIGRMLIDAISSGLREFGRCLIRRRATRHPAPWPGGRQASPRRCRRRRYSR